MGVIKKLRRLLNKRQKIKAVILLSLFVFSALLQMVSISSVAPFISILANPDFINENVYVSKAYAFIGADSHIEFLQFYAVIVCSIIVLANIVGSFVLWLSIRFTINIGSELQRKLYSTYLKNEYTFFLEKNSSDLITTITQQVPRMVYMLLQPLVNGLSQVILVIFIIVGLIIVDPQLAMLAALLVGLVYLGIYFVIRKQAVRAGEVVTEVVQRKLQLLTESIKGIREIKLLAAENWYEREVDKTTRQGLNANAFLILSGDLPRFIVEGIVFVAIIILGLFLINSGKAESDIAAILSFYALAGYKLLPAAQVIYKSLTLIKGNASAAYHISNYMDLAEKRASHVIATDVDREKFKDFRKLQLSQVNYRYPKSNNTVVSEIALDLHNNTLVAFVGGSGAGKTTIANLIAGLIRPSDGELVIDGVSIDSKNLRDWQSCIGYVPQTVFMLDDTILNNVCFGQEGEVDLERVKEACRKANLDEFIESLPLQYETKVGENGDLLSGGQKQRLAIARALYKEPSVLILDEATSALDNITERKILSEITKLSDDMLVIMIAHRLSTVELSPHIHVLESGKVIDVGSFEYLLRESDYFRELVRGSEEGEDS